MSECNDNAELVKYSLAVLFVLSSITPPSDFVEPVSSSMLNVIKTSTVWFSKSFSEYILRYTQSWRVRQNALPVLLVFLYRNLAAFSDDMILEIVNCLIDCLGDENVEVRNTAAKVFAGVLRCSQRSQIPRLRVCLSTRRIVFAHLIEFYRNVSATRNKRPLFQGDRSLDITKH
jgi:proteasome activator subunit 4